MSTVKSENPKYLVPSYKILTKIYNFELPASDRLGERLLKTVDLSRLHKLTKHYSWSPETNSLVVLLWIVEKQIPVALVRVVNFYFTRVYVAEN